MKNVSCSEMDVSWVLTIPAIWDDAAKSLMRKAAVAAELEKEDGQLMFALEPEAASLWCLASGGISLKEKDVYMVVDCGGGTVDITIHEVERADAQHPLGHTQLQDNVERAKCSFNGEINPVIQLPDSLLNSTKNDSNTPNQAVSVYNRVNQTRLQLKGYIVERKYTKVERDQTQMGVDILISDEDVFPLFADHYSVEVIGKHTINTPMNGTGSVTTGMLFGDTEIRCKSVNELGQEVETALVLT
ncbi:hypothetical protein BC938DRAFT_475515 [Jimgerdemannia flammicorona]|uniref:Heat shock protein 70 family n=1 Tax=Jimgerdemannia flammicorona TaxID=994334 RepID=A0A433PT43_9FUNG|nr:hypothetical protein BC938DRAFT_475515 [Jimgerdemannia flammicorona]